MCEMCMCLTRDGVGGRIGLGLHQSCQNMGSVGRVSLFGLRWCRWGVVRGLDQSLEGLGGVMDV